MNIPLVGPLRYPNHLVSYRYWSWHKIMESKKIEVLIGRYYPSGLYVLKTNNGNTKYQQKVRKLWDYRICKYRLGSLLSLKKFTEMFLLATTTISTKANNSVSLKSLEPQPATLLKKRLWHRCFPVNFAKFLRALFFTEHLRWLFLMGEV